MNDALIADIEAEIARIEHEGRSFTDQEARDNATLHANLLRDWLQKLKSPGEKSPGPE